MKFNRRSVLKAGLGFGASMLFRPEKLSAQAQPLIRKKIPSSGESLPIIGLGTARRYEDIKTDRKSVV